MFTVADNALRQKTRIKKIILLNHPPRFDHIDLDPLALKPAPAKLDNSTFHQLWIDSPLKHKISIGEHKLECSDSQYMKRYTD